MKLPLGTIENFRLYSVVKNIDDIKQHLEDFAEIDGFKIYHSTYTDTFYIIDDEEFEVFRTIRYEGNKLDVTKDLENYINYYNALPENDRKTILNDLKQK